MGTFAKRVPVDLPPQFIRTDTVLHNPGECDRVPLSPVCDSLFLFDGGKSMRQSTWWLLPLFGLLVFQTACDGGEAESRVDPLGVPSYDRLSPPGEDNPDDWTYDQWEWWWTYASIFEVMGDVNTPSWVSDGTPPFQLLTQITRPLFPAVWPSARHDWMATMLVDGSPGADWGGDGWFHAVPDGIRLTNYTLNSPDCSSVEDAANWVVNSRHYGRWEHLSYPLSTHRGPAEDNGHGQCDVWQDPPPNNNGGDTHPDDGSGGGDDCIWVQITIYEWVGEQWRVLSRDQVCL
jgi:hypothetical protein